MNLIAAIVALATFALATAAPEPTPLTAETILRRSQDAWIGLHTYEVPVTVSGHVRVAIISRGLGNTLSAMGTPQTWMRDYDIALPIAEAHGNHTDYASRNAETHR